MVCAACGRNLEANAQFCSSCGRALRQYPGAQPQPLSRIVRPRQGRWLAGVCAGFSQQYGWDLTIVRLVLAVAALFTGVPFLAYLIAWVVMPNAPYLLPPAPVTTETQAAAGPDSMVL